MLGTIAIVGVVTELSFDADGAALVATVSQEHRLGRWIRESKARNGFVRVQLV